MPLAHRGVTPIEGAASHTAVMVGVISYVVRGRLAFKFDMKYVGDSVEDDVDATLALNLDDSRIDRIMYFQLGGNLIRGETFLRRPRPEIELFPFAYPREQ